MKAFIMECDKQGNQLRLGTDTNFVSDEYKSIHTLKRFAFKHLKQGFYRIEGFYNWDNRYGTPDIVDYHRVSEAA